MPKVKPPLEEVLRRLPPPREEQIYVVGYGRPPLNGRIKPGEVRNPAGRPRGSKNKAKPSELGSSLQEILLREASRAVPVAGSDGTQTVDMREAIVRQLMIAAAKGNHKAQVLALKCVEKAEADQRHEQDGTLLEALTYKARWEDELEWQRRTGARGLEPVPHPDNVRVSRSGEVRIVGPTTRQDKVVWDRLALAHGRFGIELEYWQGFLHRFPETDLRDTIEAQIADLEPQVAQLSGVLGDYISGFDFGPERERSLVMLEVDIERQRNRVQEP
jgi:hypothetical protein